MNSIKWFGEEAIVDIGEFRSTTSSRCAAVLRQMIQQRAVEEL